MAIPEDTLIPPLSWPRSFVDRGAAARFFADLPVLGLHARTLRGFHRAVSERSPEQVAAAWEGRDERQVALARELSALIAEELEWPAGRFLPEDPCDIVLWESEPDLRDAALLLEIEDRFEVEVPESLLREGTFAELVELVSGGP